MLTRSCASLQTQGECQPASANVARWSDCLPYCCRLMLEMQDKHRLRELRSSSPPKKAAFSPLDAGKDGGPSLAAR
eukprot:scaffold25295_cov13-Tisochrysis_lutea.AAC.1